MDTTTIIDRNGIAIQPETRVWVKVGSSLILRPGIVERVSPKGARVTFRWANGRETHGRMFNVWERTTGRVEEVEVVRQGESSAWVVAWATSAPKSEEVGS